MNEDDIRLFHEAIGALSGEVRLLRHDRVTCRPPRPSTRPRQRDLDEETILRDMLSDYDPGELEHGEVLLYRRDGVSHQVLRKLRRGQYSVGAVLDLHGHTVDEARTALTRFLNQHRGHPYRCVRIIHGKGYHSPTGQGKLKRLLNRWLPQREDVLAFCSARPMDGGTGALYVLLKG
ncbi:MAG: Smr/MutS family protein [Halothiobacillaceae bacterium]